MRAVLICAAASRVDMSLIINSKRLSLARFLSLDLTMGIIDWNLNNLDLTRDKILNRKIFFVVKKCKIPVLLLLSKYTGIPVLRV